MAYRLRNTVGACRVDDRTIFLDLEADRYFGLGAEADAAFQNLVNGVLADPVPPALSQLIERGILLADDHCSAPLTLTAYPAPTLQLSEPDRRPAPSMIVCAGLAQIQAARALRRRTLAMILRPARDRRLQSGGATDNAEALYAAVAAAISRYDRLWGAVDRCLIRSLAFLSMAAHAGRSPSLVFGVQARPFSAHCWIEEDGVLLNDRLENVQPYTPILVI